MSTPAVVVGLGNPGPEYERTRHNVGFRVADALAARVGTRFRPAKGLRALTAEARDGDLALVLAKPTTFMNESGEAVAALVRARRVPIEYVVVVHDEIDLPLGVIRVKRGGGDAGHRGLGSITRAIGGGYARVRVGVGRPPGAKDAAGHVLARFSRTEEKEAGVVVEEAADAVMAVLHEGVEAAQSRYHASEAPEQRAVVRRVEVDAPVADVWRVWTTAEGARALGAAEARIELRRGGAYAVRFEPEGEGGAVLAFEQERFLVFSWGAPQHRASTRVEVRFSEAGPGRTAVEIRHTGWRAGWEEAFAAAGALWERVAGLLFGHFGPTGRSR